MAEEDDSLEKFAKDLDDHLETEIIKYSRLETGQIEWMEKTLRNVRKELRKASKDLKDMAKERVRLNEEAKQFVEGRKKLNAFLQKKFENVGGEILTLLRTKEHEIAQIFFPAESTLASQGVPILYPAEATQGDMETSVPTQTAQDEDSGIGSRAKRKRKHKHKHRA
ncbi:hypothetical protein CKAN_00105700 [Cinnamomum micranthum f. kanehirae]|uniref:Uncharacterized protein n=1 Tax=Cinnamomum micranthum f. kanehirae TaxID=337451 RepID=A0A443N2T4_9MAGN|nr:hypothetical protein CKAN_00105700 [Cinnamomum micranthum f. kanehirae]